MYRLQPFVCWGNEVASHCPTRHHLLAELMEERGFDNRSQAITEVLTQHIAYLRRAMVAISVA
jgi:hypothetical protein